MENTNTDVLGKQFIELRYLLNSHDWSYQLSNSKSKWGMGNATEQKITQLIQWLIEYGIDVMDIYEFCITYRPTVLVEYDYVTDSIRSWFNRYDDFIG
jgi:hypothetical protein